jgi:outer membrane protein TolC
MKPAHRVIVFALLLLLPPAADAQTGGTGAPPLTIGEAIGRVQSSHESLRAADAERAQREEERKAAKSLYWPRVEAAARVTQIDRPIELDLSPIRDVILALHPQVPAAAVPPFVETFQEERFWRANVQATWPVYTGGKVAAANRAAEARVDDAKAGRQLTGNALVTELARRYYGLRLARNAREVRANVLRGIDEHLREATRLEEEGMISRAERLHATVARADADRELKRAEQDVEIARAGLANILSLPEAGDPSSPLVMGVALEPLERFEEAAGQSHPAFDMLAAQRSLATEALKAEKGKFLPDVYLFGMRELHEGGLTILDPKWAVGAGVSWTLFDGFDRSHKVAAARLQRQRVDEVERRARRDIATVVEKRYRELTKAREQFDALEAALDLGRENLRVRTRAFEEGFATSLDVVDARLSLSRVELERLAAAYDYDVALAELLEQSGQSARFEQILATGRPVTK